MRAVHLDLYREAQSLVLALLGKKTCEEDPLAMVCAIEMLCAFHATPRRLFNPVRRARTALEGKSDGK